MKRQYRIVRHSIVSDSYFVEFRTRLLPFWRRASKNWYSKENAENYAHDHSRGFVVKDLGWLP